jgi:hypothetical protein
MRSYHFTETTTATPQQVLDAITDFGPGREEIFGNSASKFLEVHDLGDTYADVTEGTGKGDKPVSWERLAYDWSDPSRVTMKVLDSNIFTTSSGHVYTITPQADGTTQVDVVVRREGKNLKGRVISLVVSTIGKSGLAKAFRNTLRAIEARNHADERELVAA